MSHPRCSTIPAALVVAALAITIAAPPASAQYFGRNKVQYETFDFRIMETENFDIYFYPEEEEAVEDAARMVERWYERLSNILDHRFEERQPFIFYASHPHFQQTTTLGSSISEGTGGFTEVFQQRVVMPFTYSYEETDHVVGHELVHAFQYDISGLGRAGAGLEAAARRFQVPGWFIEGMAEYLSVGPIDPMTAMWVREAALRGDIPTIQRMTRDPNVFPYRWGQALWAYVGGRWGDRAIGQILKLVGQGVPYQVAFQRILNISLDDLSDEWHASIRQAYLPLLGQLAVASDVARPLITQEERGGRINLAPVLSPDGRHIAFISELDFLDIEIHLADAQTGEVIRRLQRGTAFDPHFGSLRYINSAGAFSPDGSQFVFSALRGGNDVLVLLDVERGSRLREIPVTGVGEISNPAWSPDGSTIVFSGLSGGINDLYAVDVASGQSRKLTDDRYTELHPSFSPDGRTLAFTTDRGPGTDFETLTYGPYRVAVMDLASRAIELVPGMDGEKNINPVWSRDGGSLFFISNRNGVPNIYRVEVASGAVFRLTNLFGGVSGITDISPALTAARDRDQIAFTSFEGGNRFDIYTIENGERLAGVPVSGGAMAAEDTTPPVTAILPPIPRPQEPAFNRVSMYLDDATRGLPALETVAQYNVRPYRPSLTLDYLGQPSFGISAGGPFGGGVYGGVAGIFSDVLGRHSVMGAVQAQGQLDEVGFALQYMNTRDRWNYGVAAQRVPFVSGFLNFGRDTVSTQDGPVTVPTQELWRVRFFDSRLQGAVQYPFSQVQRMDFRVGVRRIATDFQIFKVLFDPATGAAFDTREEEIDGFGLNMAEASAALVYDNAAFGYTSPIAGQRYRFEVSPTIGELQYMTALADYRRYFFFRPFTFAVRGLHQGRYGRDSDGIVEGQRIFYDMFLGQPHLIRGYYNTFSECRRNRTNNLADCGVLNQLLGSRVAVANAEFRFPLVERLMFGQSFGFPPIEGLVFADAGLAWDRESEVIFERFDPSDPQIDPTTGFPLTNERRIVTSAGVGARFNIFGYFILEVDYVNGFQRSRGWHWQFNLQPGF